MVSGGNDAILIMWRGRALFWELRCQSIQVLRPLRPSTRSIAIVATYGELKAKWEQIPDKSPSYSVWSYSISHPVTAPEFCEELFVLALATGDQRFMQALEAMVDLKLTDQAGAWLKNLQHPMIAAQLQRKRDHLFELVEQFLSGGSTLRHACARAVVEAALE